MASLQQRIARLPPEQREELLKRLARNGDAAGATAIEIAPVRSAPLSLAQQRLWFLSGVDSDRGSYHVCFSLRLRGRLNIPALGRALDELAARHESLRTRFDASGEQPIQVAEAEARQSLDLVDLSSMPELAARAQASFIQRVRASRPFDLTRAPLVRVTLLRYAALDHSLHFTLHHLICDGWSVRVLVEELTALYQSAECGAGHRLPPLSIQPLDVALREQSPGADGIEYWRERLAGVPATLLPARRGTGVRADRVWTAALPLSAELTRSLRTFSRERGTTAFTVLLAALQVLLFRYSGSTDVPVGCSVANRNVPELESLVGFFVNMVVLRSDLSGNPGFGALVDRVRETVLDGFEHTVPFELLVRSLQPDREPGRTPFFQAAFDYQEAPELPVRSASGLSWNVEAVERGAAAFDLTVFAIDMQERIVISMECRDTLLDSDALSRMLEHYCTVLADVLKDQSMRLSALLISGPELNRTAADYPNNITVHEAFERIVGEYPDRVAAVYDGEHVTYSELNRRADGVARELARRGAGRSAPVVLTADRSIWMLAGMLGILKAGSAYLPLDPGLPPERFRQITLDAGATLVFTEGGVVEGIDKPRTDERATPDDIAYVICTSGSTGVPKRVAVSHRAIFPLVFNSNYFRFGPDRRMAQASTCSFDAATFEIWGGLLHGARLIGIPKLTGLEPEKLSAKLHADDVDALFLTPALFHATVREEPRAFERLHDLLLGGDAPDPEMVRLCLEGGGPPKRLLNAYGPTEAVTFSIWHEITSVPGDGSGVPIGRPLSNSRAYLLNRALLPVPVGVEGEIYLGGESLATGYAGLPALTAERFVPDPSSPTPGARIYRTGDSGLLRADGVIEYHGRRDRQIKLRGFRIEPGEVEQTLRRHPAVREAVVAWDRGAERIDAFIVAAPVSAAEIREWLKRRLPGYSIPGRFVFLDSLPLTPGGKIDWAALRSSAGSAHNGSGELPLTPTEEMIAAVWRRELGLEHVGRADNFFDLGGHSLMAARIVFELRRVFRGQVPLAWLFEAPTIGSLASRIETMRPGAAPLDVPRLEPVSREGDLELSFAQQRLWFAHLSAPDPGVYNSTAALRWKGILPIEFERLRAALERIVARHEALRTVFAERDGRPVQVILPPARLALPVVDLRGLDADAARSAATIIATKHGRAPFDLRRGPVYRFTLVRATEAETRLLVAVHHIAFDAVSLDVFMRELAEGSSHVARLPIQYADYSAWQRRLLESEDGASRLRHWVERLRGAPQLLDLPIDFPRPPVPSHRGDVVTLPLRDDAASLVEDLARSRQATPFVVLLAACFVLLQRWCGRDDFLVATDITGRDSRELEPLIGFFVNILPLRADLAGKPSFDELLDSVRATVADAFDHAGTPFDRIVEAVCSGRPRDRQPLVQVLFSYRDRNEPADDGWSLDSIESTTASQWELALIVRKNASGRMSLGCLYQTSLFRAETIRTLTAEYCRILDAALQRRLIMETPSSNFPSLSDVSAQPFDFAGGELVSGEPFNGTTRLPFIFRPRLEGVDLIAWAASHRDEIEQRLADSGAVLFDGFGIGSPAEFQRLAEVFCPELYAEYGDLPRHPEGGSVYAATPYPPEEWILFHNEGVHTAQWPLRIFFCCALPSLEGGETPIADCRAMLQDIEPAVLERFERQGCRYVRNFMFDQSYFAGLDVSWTEFFRTDDPAEVERHCAAGGLDLEWGTDKSLRISKQSAVVRAHPRTGERVFCSQLLTHHISCLNDAIRRSVMSLFDERHLPRNVYYGDGGAIDDSVIQSIRKSYEKRSVTLPWKKGNVMMLDNMLAAHARRPYSGPRKVLVAMGDMLSEG